jgi:branched-chain amino acid aminotransferase
MSIGRFINHQGKIMSTNSLNLGTENRSFRYGDGLFETIRGVGGDLPFWNFHMQRLKQGMDVLAFDYSHWNWKEIQTNALQLLQENEHLGGAKLRLSVYRAGNGTYKPTTSKAEYILESHALPNQEFVINPKGKQIDYFTRVKKPVNVLSMVKSANALVYVLAAEHAVKMNLDDSLILNSNNELCEATSSNLFIIRDDRVYTPPLSSGCLPGIMRMVVINILAQKGLKVIENPISPNELILAEEVFLTNSIEGITWVSGYQNKRYYKKFSELFLKDINALVRGK